MPGAALTARLILVLLALALPASAAAEDTPIDVGVGSHARVAADAAGVLHVAFSQTNGAQDTTHYCRLDPGSSSCANEHLFTYPQGPELGSDSGAWPLLPGDGRLFVLDARCCTNYSTKFVYPSGDGGLTFGPQTEVGDDNNSGANVAGSALYAPPGSAGRPGESILTLTDLATLGLSFQATTTTGPPERTTQSNVLTQSDAISGSLGLSGGSLVAAWTSIDDNTVYWRQYTGAGDVNNSASWTPITVLDAANIDSGSRLASGPSGIYVAYDRGDPGNAQVVLRKFTGSGWSDPVPLTEAGESPRFFDLVEDPTGALHLAWQSNTGQLRYRFATGGDNATFTAPRTLLEQNPNSGYFDLRLGVSGAAKWVVWEDSNPVHVRALPIAPGLLPPPVIGETVNVVPLKGTVKVKLPAGAGARAKDPWTRAAAAGFVPLTSIGRQVPVGSTLDTTHGTVELSSARGVTGGLQTGQFNSGLFSVGQGRKNPLTIVSMKGAGLSKCSKLPRGGSAKAIAARRRKRSLFSSVHGRFRTRGRNSAATVRGTSYLMTDTCAGTLTQVRTGTVTVRDFRLRKNKRVRAGHRYFARAPRKR